MYGVCSILCCYLWTHFNCMKNAPNLRVNKEGTRYDIKYLK